jgi:hypothetical protein
MARLLELLKAKVSASEKEEFEAPQILLLKDIERETPNNKTVNKKRNIPTYTRKNNRLNVPRKKFNSKLNTVSENNENNNETKPNNTRKKNNANVARNNVSKLRIKAPSNENINNVKKSERRTALRKTRPLKFEEPKTNPVHRGEFAPGMSGPSAPASSNMFRRTQKKGESVLNKKQPWKP